MYLRQSLWGAATPSSTESRKEEERSAGSAAWPTAAARVPHTGLGRGVTPGFEFQIPHRLAMQFGTTSSIFLSLHFLLCNVGI